MHTVVFWEYFQHYHSDRVRHLIDSSQLNGHTITPVALSDCTLDGHRAEPSTDIRDVTRVLLPNRPDANVTSPDAALALIRLLEEENPDVVVVIGWHGQVVHKALRWARRNKKGVVMMVSTQWHDKPRVWWKEKIKTWTLRRYVDVVFCGGCRHREYVERLGFPQDRVYARYEAVDTHRWSGRAKEVRVNEQDWRDRLGLHRKMWVASGRMIDKKNFSGLLKAYANYREQTGVDAWDLVITGDGPLRDDLESQAKELKVSDSVHFPGYLDFELQSAYFALGEAMVFPSDREEQWGLVVNEAMASGLPVLASEICGAAGDMIVEGKTGYSFNPVLTEEIVQHMVYLHRNSAIRERMVSHVQKMAHQYGLDNFTLSFWEACEQAFKMKYI